MAAELNTWRFRGCFGHSALALAAALQGSLQTKFYASSCSLAPLVYDVLMAHPLVIFALFTAASPLCAVKTMQLLEFARAQVTCGRTGCADVTKFGSAAHESRSAALLCIAGRSHARKVRVGDRPRQRARAASRAAGIPLNHYSTLSQPKVPQLALGFRAHGIFLPVRHAISACPVACHQVIEMHRLRELVDSLSMQNGGVFAGVAAWWNARTGLCTTFRECVEAASCPHSLLSAAELFAVTAWFVAWALIA